jgi:hypothetical protein
MRRIVYGATIAYFTVQMTALAATPATLEAQAAPQAPAAAPGAISVTASLRTRAENWDWFGDEDGGSYTFVGSLLRAGVAQQQPLFGWRIEAAAPLLLGLPEDAVAPPPRGQLGLGAAYYTANDGKRNPIGLFVKQAFVRFGRPPARGGHSLRLGRFEFGDGTETAPAQPTLAALKREHIAQRLIGTFPFTHVGRSFDGAHYAFHTPGVNLTLVAAQPTRGAFDVNGWSSLDIQVGYGALTRPFAWGGGAGEGRLFGLFYRDGRNVVKTDNRPLAARQADRDEIALTTAGAHYLHVFAMPQGEVDLLLWGALQIGDWGLLDHRANAGAVELGYGFPAVGGIRPWLRTGYARTSGDADAADGRHGTFFQVLPTARGFARFPFYNLMNTEDVFGSLRLRGARASLRADVRRVRLSEPADLWYAGSGAFQREGFGYAGRPIGGQRDLATVIDLGAEYRPSPRLTLSAYGAHARSGNVIENIHPERPWGRLFFLEGEIRR